jgi:hypothetical protein
MPRTSGIRNLRRDLGTGQTESVGRTLLSAAFEVGFGFKKMWSEKKQVLRETQIQKGI